MKLIALVLSLVFARLDAASNNFKPTEGESIPSKHATALAQEFKPAESKVIPIALSSKKFYEELGKLDRDDWDAVEKFLQTQAKAGQVDAMYELGVSDFLDWGYCATAKIWLSQAFRVGKHPLAALYMGDIYSKGCPKKVGFNAFEPDSRLALYWYKKAAKRHVSRACMEIGLFYLNGRGVTKNKNEAVKWFKKGAAMPLPYEGNRLQLEELEDDEN